MPVELLTPDEMSSADRMTAALAGDSFPLMQAAGQAVAKAALEMSSGGPILVLAGPGNNGGDGLVAAALLRRRGLEARVALLGEGDRLTGDAARAAAQYDGPLERLHAETDLHADLVVDALFGAGLTRPLDGLAAFAVAAVNAGGRPVLAVDLPSGVNGRTGEASGPAIRARRTVTFFRLKPGHLLLPGRTHCGEVRLAQIGISESVLQAIRPNTFHNLPAVWSACWPSLDPCGHKYGRGHAFVVSGPATATGAARLAAAGALRVGAGLVTVASPLDALAVNAAHLTAIMLRGFADPDELARLLGDPRAKAVLIGPAAGIGAETRANVEAALAGPAAAVLDADALTSFADDPAALWRLIARRAAPVVLTPHEGEFARIFAMSGARIDRARQAAAESGAVLVLKGPDTVIADPGGRLAVNANAPPDLATAGSGDVLAGMIAGLMAQGMPAFDAAAAAVWLHGEAGAALGRGLIAEDLPQALPPILRRLDAAQD